MIWSWIVFVHFYTFFCDSHPHTLGTTRRCRFYDMNFRLSVKNCLLSLDNSWSWGRFVVVAIARDTWVFWTRCSIVRIVYRAKVGLLQLKIQRGGVKRLIVYRIDNFCFSMRHSTATCTRLSSSTWMLHGFMRCHLVFWPMCNFQSIHRLRQHTQCTIDCVQAHFIIHSELCEVQISRTTCLNWYLKLFFFLPFDTHEKWVIFVFTTARAFEKSSNTSESVRQALMMRCLRCLHTLFLERVRGNSI